AGRYAYHPLSVAPSRLKAPITPFTPRALSARAVDRQVAAYARGVNGVIGALSLDGATDRG
ncbi:hypothetical protein XarbCFBP8150_21800, partial [Xanthomonas arboricola]|uniref:hypothetical protein n=1 Tax=Xanthomonas arboricola TaxID=56448 RepID=UPI000D482146